MTDAERFVKYAERNFNQLQVYNPEQWMWFWLLAYAEEKWIREHHENPNRAADCDVCDIPF